MTEKIQDFWQHFNAQAFERSAEALVQLNNDERVNVLKKLFQQSGHQKTPLLVSVLRRTLKDEHTFNDFYQAWHPKKDMCRPVNINDLHYLQHFPTPVRVINGTNLNAPKEIVSVGISWANNKRQEKQLLTMVHNASESDDHNNQVRHDNISEVADGELIGLFKVESDDNLGTPF